MPVHKCGTGWKYGDKGKCYKGKGARRKAEKQAAAIRASGYVENALRRADPLKNDPTHTHYLRERFAREMRTRMAIVRRRILKSVLEDDDYGFVERRPLIDNVGNDGATVTNRRRFEFLSSSEKVRQFESWLQTQFANDVLDMSKPERDRWWNKYTQEGYLKGAGRAFDDTRKPALAQGRQGGVSDFYKGTKEEFLRSSFGHAVSIDKVKLLAGRTFTDLKNVTEATATQLSRTLSDGLVQGKGLRAVAGSLVKDIDGIGKRRAELIARTETIRAHAEGQLDALEKLGVESVGVAVEWSTAGDSRVCPLCAPLEGVVMSIKEARGTIPRHPACRCSYIPANVGEDKKEQQRTKAALEKARDESIRREIPAKSKRTLAEQKNLTKWKGADTKFKKVRPASILDRKKPPEFSAAPPMEVGMESISGDAQSNRDLVQGALSRVPNTLKRIVERNGTKIIVTDDGLSSIFPVLKGMNARGYPPGTTMDVVDGIYNKSTKDIGISRRTFRADGTVLVRSTERLQNVTRHEYGHALDYALMEKSPSLGSKSKTFLSAYADDAAKLNTPDLQRKMAYFLQKGNGPEEAFAEAFASLTGGSPDPLFAKMFPKTMLEVKRQADAVTNAIKAAGQKTVLTAKEAVKVIGRPDVPSVSLAPPQLMSKPIREKAIKGALAVTRFVVSDIPRQYAEVIPKLVATLKDQKIVVKYVKALAGKGTWTAADKVELKAALFDAAKFVGFQAFDFALPGTSMMMPFIQKSKLLSRLIPKHFAVPLKEGRIARFFDAVDKKLGKEALEVTINVRYSSARGWPRLTKGQLAALETLWEIVEEDIERLNRQRIDFNVDEQVLALGLT